MLGLISFQTQTTLLLSISFKKGGISCLNEKGVHAWEIFCKYQIAGLKSKDTLGLFQLQSGWCLGASAEIIGQELSCARMGLPWASLLPSFNWASLLNQPPSTSSPILSRFVCGPDTALSFYQQWKLPLLSLIESVVQYVGRRCLG